MENEGLGTQEALGVDAANGRAEGNQVESQSIEFIAARLYFDKKLKKEFDQRVANTATFVREFQTWYNKNKSNLEREDTYSAIQPTVDVPLFYLKENGAGN